VKPLTNFLRVAAAMLSGLAILSGCGDGDSDSTSSTGTLSVAMTDAPACGYDNVFVTVEKVRVHESEDAEEGDGGWHEIVVSPAKRIDLLELTNGTLEELGQTDLPAGTYTQMRLVLASNAFTPGANAVVPTGGSEVELTTPSGQETGLKMNLDVTVEPDKVAKVVIDFDACKSVVKAGASGQYLLKPVLSAILVLSDAGQRIVGYLDTLTLGANTNVSAQSGSIVAKATIPDANGMFVLYPVDPGTYDLVIASDGKATAVMTGVEVVTTTHTNVSSDTVRIALADSPTANATGNVTLNGSGLNTGATVRALQAVYNGPTVEVASMPVDASSGTFTFALPLGSPQVTTYVANPVAIVFAPDSADSNLTAAGKYTLEASIDGLAPQIALINLLTSTDPTIFSFPAP
jgi:hypothetical protein